MALELSSVVNCGFFSLNSPPLQLSRTIVGSVDCILLIREEGVSSKFFPLFVKAAKAHVLGVFFGPFILAWHGGQ
jgi:hypothetical protein